MDLSTVEIIVFALIVAVPISFKKLIKICDKEAKIDWNHRWLNRLDGLNRWLCHSYHQQAREYLALPDKGPAIVVANHISGLDPFVLLAASKRPLRFLVAREQYNRFGFNWLFKATGCIPVDREKNPERALHEALDALGNGEVVAIFPQGGIHWPTNLQTKLKGGAVRLAQRRQCDIYPVFISGVRLKGFTVPALLVRSNINLKFHAAIQCHISDYETCMTALAQILNQSEDEQVSKR